LKEDI